MNLTWLIFMSSWSLPSEIIPTGCYATAPLYMAGKERTSTLVAMERNIP